jgi:hypothetical protein
MSKGFGNPKKSKFDILAESAVFYCQQRSPEKLNTIFDYQLPEINHQICDQAIAVLDIDTIAWFCGYLASEINCTQDNNNPYPIGELSGFLISLGFKLFKDFTPYPGCRLVIANTEKFQSLPQETQDTINQFFQIQEKSSEESQQINNAILQELQL